MKGATMITVVALAVLGSAQPAAAHKLAEKPARKAVAKQAAAIQRETRAMRYEITECDRLSRHAWECLVALYYETGAERCEVPVKVSARGHRTRRLRRELGQTICY